MTKKSSIPEFADVVSDSKTNEEYWWNRPKCIGNGCLEKALSFERRCWNHLSNKERIQYREKIEYFCTRTKIFYGLNLEYVNLGSINFKNVVLWGANLKKAKLAHANLTWANLGYTNLVGADLIHADLNSAFLGGADIRGADMSFVMWGRSGIYRKTHSVNPPSFYNKDQSQRLNVRIMREMLEYHIPKIFEFALPTEVTQVQYNQQSNISKYIIVALLWIMRCFISRLSLLIDLIDSIDIMECNKFNRICSHKERINYAKEIVYFSLEILDYINWSKRPIKEEYKRTNFQGLNTSDLDWSRHPKLMKDIRYQQHLDYFRYRSLIHKWVLYPLWGISSKFGQSIKRWLAVSFISIAFFGMIFYLNPDLTSINGSYENWFDAFYHSWLIFTSLGVSIISPRTFGAQMLILIEVMLGFIMLGSLVSFFANKFVRRD